MLLQSMKCPYGCEKSTFTESTKTLKGSNDNLLLEGNQLKKVKVYTCGCCNRTFEIPISNEQSQVLFS